MDSSLEAKSVHWVRNSSMICLCFCTTLLKLLLSLVVAPENINLSISYTIYNIQYTIFYNLTKFSLNKLSECTQSEICFFRAGGELLRFRGHFRGHRGQNFKII